MVGSTYLTLGRASVPPAHYVPKPMVWQIIRVGSNPSPGGENMMHEASRPPPLNISCTAVAHEKQQKVIFSTSTTCHYAPKYCHIFVSVTVTTRLIWYVFVHLCSLLYKFWESVLRWTHGCSGDIVKWYRSWCAVHCQQTFGRVSSLILSPLPFITVYTFICLNVKRGCFNDECLRKGPMFS